MDWRDLLYFSNNERKALTLLFLLIVAGGVALFVSDKYRKHGLAEAEPLYIVQPENAPLPVQPDTTSPAVSPQLSPRKSPRSRTPQQAAFPRNEKFPAGSIVELNTADTATLKKVPGIGSVFAGRIVKYRALLGGFYSVEQLREVYGIDEERYLSLQKWFHVDTSFIAKLPVNHLASDTLAKHPYISYRQARIIGQLCRQKGRLDGWENLRLLEEFTEADRARLFAYLSFR
ncbi:MAG: helix-hairpin-helix domain-containing protein [Tannerellaceae bacterium]|jgi:DNA uptake protein ComE-like DNA-binding protein|nr:helix-hairpin-helix domain-containing protein [Tannerellaceae bacterium]